MLRFGRGHLQDLLTTWLNDAIDDGHQSQILILPSMAEFQSPHKSNLCSTWWLVILDGFLTFKTFKEYLQMMMSPHHPHPSTSTSSRCFLAWQIRMRSPQGAGEKWKKTWSKDVSADVAYRGFNCSQLLSKYEFQMQRCGIGIDIDIKIYEYIQDTVWYLQIFTAHPFMELLHWVCQQHVLGIWFVPTSKNHQSQPETYDKE